MSKPLLCNDIFEQTNHYACSTEEKKCFNISIKSGRHASEPQYNLEDML